MSAFRHRDFRLLWPGTLVSYTGTWIQISALLWYVKSITGGSDSWVAVVNMASYLPVFLFVPFAGSLADQVNRKKLIVVNQVIMMACSFALAATIDLGRGTLPVIMILVAVNGISVTFNLPAWQAIVSDLVPTEDLLNGIALTSAAVNMAEFVGPAVAGIILGIWSVSGAFYINGVSFLFVIVAVLLMRTRTPPGPPPPEGTLRHIGEGFRYVIGNRWALAVLVAFGIASFFGLSYVVLMPAVTTDLLGRQEGAYGLLLGMMGLGAVACAPLIGFLGRRIPENRMIRVSALLFGLFELGLGLSNTYWISLLMTVGLGGSFLVLGSAVNEVLQARAERDMRGRMMGFYTMMFLGVFPLGGLLLGALSDLKGPGFALSVGAAAVIAMSVVLTALPGLTAEARSDLGAA